jgi:PAS domain S-box-containing protein
MIKLEDWFTEENAVNDFGTSSEILYPTKEEYEPVGKILHEGLRLGREASADAAPKHAEKTLRATEERLRSVTERMPVMMDAFDEQGTIIFWNRECERATGFSSEEIVGNPKAMNLLYPDESYLSKMLEERKKRGFDYYDWKWQIATKKGEVRTIAWSNVSGRFPIAGCAWWAFGIDVTDRKEAK